MMSTPIFSFFFLVLTFLTSSSLQMKNTCTHTFQSQLVTNMNRVRRAHGEPPLMLNLRPGPLAVFAQKYAEYKAGYSRYPPKDPPVAYSAIYVPFESFWEDANSLVQKIALIGDDYPYYCQEPPTQTEKNYYGVFTQMIWLASQNITFGCVDTFGGFRHLFGVLVPPANLDGQYAHNVLPPGGHCNGKNDPVESLVKSFKFK